MWYDRLSDAATIFWILVIAVPLVSVVVHWKRDKSIQ
jgi:hypothetical protein